MEPQVTTEYESEFSTVIFIPLAFETSISSSSDHSLETILTRVLTSTCVLMDKWTVNKQHEYIGKLTLPPQQYTGSGGDASSSHHLLRYNIKTDQEIPTRMFGESNYEYLNRLPTNLWSGQLKTRMFVWETPEAIVFESPPDDEKKMMFINCLYKHSIEQTYDKTNFLETIIGQTCSISNAYVERYSMRRTAFYLKPKFATDIKNIRIGLEHNSKLSGSGRAKLPSNEFTNISIEMEYIGPIHTESTEVFMRRKNEFVETVTYLIMNVIFPHQTGSTLLRLARLQNDVLISTPEAIPSLLHAYTHRHSFANSLDEFVKTIHDIEQIDNKRIGCSLQVKFDGIPCYAIIVETDIYFKSKLGNIWREGRVPHLCATPVIVLAEVFNDFQNSLIKLEPERDFVVHTILAVLVPNWFRNVFKNTVTSVYNRDEPSTKIPPRLVSSSSSSSSSPPGPSTLQQHNDNISSSMDDGFQDVVKPSECVTFYGKGLYNSFLPNVEGKIKPFADSKLFMRLPTCTSIKVMSFFRNNYQINKWFIVPYCVDVLNEFFGTTNNDDWSLIDMTLFIFVMKNRLIEKIVSVGGARADGLFISLWTKEQLNTNFTSTTLPFDSYGSFNFKLKITDTIELTTLVPRSNMPTTPSLVMTDQNLNVVDLCRFTGPILSVPWYQTSWAIQIIDNTLISGGMMKLILEFTVVVEDQQPKGTGWIAIFANDTNNGNEQEIFVEFLVKLSLIESQTNISVHEFNAIRTCIMSDEKLAKLVDKFGFACRCIKSDKRFNTILNNLRYNTDNYGMWVQMLEAMQTTNLSSILNTKIYTSGNDDSYSQRSAAPVPIGAASSSRTKKQQLLTGFAKSNGKKTPQQPRQRGRCVGRNNVGDSSSSLVEIVFKPKTKWDTIVGGQNMSPKIISNSTTLDDLCKLALMNCEPMLRARCMEKVSSTPYVKFLNKIAASNSYISEDVICAIVCMRMLCNVKSSDLWPTGLENIIFGQVSEEGGLKLCPTLKYAFHMKRPFVILAEWSSQVVTTTKRTKKNTQEVDTDNLREKWETDGVAFLNFDRMLPPMTSSFGDLVSEEMGGYYANNTRLILFLIVVLVEILHWTASVHNSMQLMHPAIMVHISLPRRCKFL
ncbi:hypothetical protein WDU94_012440 [Cyamophila willieti]